MQQHFGNVDFDWADLITRSAQTRGIGKRFRVLHTHELRCENSTNGARINRTIGMTTSTRIDWTNIEARTTANAMQRLTPHLIGKHISAPIIEQHQVEALRTISRRYSCP